MIQRCPTSKYLGIARLNSFRWIINDRGYANIVQTSTPEEASSDEVWGLVYSLQHSDEKNLDVNEGVPIAYTKEYISVDFWPVHNNKAPDMKDKPQRSKMLVYIDRKRIAGDKAKKEYIYRMNMGIKDALKEGMPKQYLENVMRKFIPDVEDETVAKVAKKQALLFEDER